jgi:LPPG:FO 2-phospho-L-lactate transferase
MGRMILITTLAGGVGAAKFLQGLVKILKDEEICVIVNTGDDIELYGLYISPDIDIVIYTLAGMVNEGQGWGVRGDTFHCLKMLESYGHKPWFRLGDLDLATHINRTSLMKQGLKLSEITKQECDLLDVKAKIIPMTDNKVSTMIYTDQGMVHFQEYLVKRGATDRVLNVKFKGIDKASPAPDVIENIKKSRGIIICPSNPIVSIGTILSVPGMKESLLNTKATVIGISPIISGLPVKGPADKIMRGLGLEVSAYQVAKLYSSFLDVFVIDVADRMLVSKIEKLGIKVIVAKTLMKGIKEKKELAKIVLKTLER